MLFEQKSNKSNTNSVKFQFSTFYNFSTKTIQWTVTFYNQRQII